MDILLAVDNTPHSNVAVDVLLNRMWPDGSTFKVFCAIDRSDSLLGSLKANEADDIYNKALESAKQLTDEIAKKISAAFPKCSVTSEATIGDCKELILAQANALKADLIVMGSRGRQGVTRIVLGSVSQTVLLHGNCSTLIARYQHAHEGVAEFDKKVLVAVDDSDHSRSALEWTLNMPWSSDTQFMLLSVLPPAVDNYDGFEALHSRNVNKDRSKQTNSTRDFLRDTQEQFEKAFGETRVKAELRDGAPAETILEAARTWQAGLLILGSRAHTQLKRMFMGSVSQEVVLQAPCPVEVVKAVKVAAKKA